VSGPEGDLRLRRVQTLDQTVVGQEEKGGEMSVHHILRDGEVLCGSRYRNMISTDSWENVTCEVCKYLKPKTIDGVEIKHGDRIMMAGQKRVWVFSRRCWGVYFDFNDWWVGYRRGSQHHHICLLPTLVFRLENKRTRALRAQFQQNGIYVMGIPSTWTDGGPDTDKNTSSSGAGPGFAVPPANEMGLGESAGEDVD
jgi:hypothetical protein